MAQKLFSKKWYLLNENSIILFSLNYTNCFHCPLCIWYSHKTKFLLNNYFTLIGKKFLAFSKVFADFSFLIMGSLWKAYQNIEPANPHTPKNCPHKIICIMFWRTCTNPTFTCRIWFIFEVPNTWKQTKVIQSLRSADLGTLSLMLWNTNGLIMDQGHQLKT